MAGKAGKDGKTRHFNSVSYSTARLAREKQKREYEKQKKEKLIFSLFVVSILVMILFAILVFRNVLIADNSSDTDLPNDTQQGASESGQETESTPVIASAYRNEVLAKSDIHKGNLLLIDSSHPYREDAPALKNAAESRTGFQNSSAKNGIAYAFYVGSTSLVMLEEQTLGALNAMANAFYEETQIYDLYIPTNSAYVEGAANDHATGRAFDLLAWPGGSTFLELDDDSYGNKFALILNNHHKYGFVSNSCGNTGLHLLYVGVPHASYMAKNNLSLASYLALLRTNHSFAENGKNNLVFTAEDGNRYEVYYVEANGDMINVPVPTSGDFTVSGDNQNGFVVTVKLN